MSFILKNNSAPSYEKEELPFYKLVLKCGVFLLIFCLVTVISVFIVSAICYNTSDPTSKISLAASISLYISTFFTSFVMIRVNRQKWLFGGIILGIMIMLLLFLLSLFSNNPTSENIIMKLIVLPISIISAFLGKRRDGKKPKFKKYREMKNLR